MKPTDLAKVSIFQGLPPDVLARAAELFPEHTVGAGDILCAEGAVADALYVVCEGKVEVVKATDKGPKVLAQLGPGEFFGEMGVFKAEPRAATVRAVDESVVGRIVRDDLLELVGGSPLIGMRIRTEIVRRHTANISKLLQ